MISFTRSLTLLKSMKCNMKIAHFATTTQKCQEQKLLINGQTINYLKVGNGQHALLCFPGALGTIWSDFKPQVEKLDRNKFTVVAWDPPGYGHSSPPKRTYTKDFYETDAEWAHLLMRNLKIDRYSLLGWSDGGISSMILAAKYPKEVYSLIIWGSNSYILPEEVESYEKIRDISKWSEKMKAPLIKLYGEQGLQDMWNGWCDAVINIYKLNNGDICKGKLSNIKCPTLILHGNKDPMVAAEHPEFLLANIKGSKIHRFPEGKHNIHLRYADDFNKIISEFILQSSL